MLYITHMTNTTETDRDAAFTAECAADEDARADRRFAAWQRRQRQESVRVARVAQARALEADGIRRLLAKYPELR